MPFLFERHIDPKPRDVLSEGPKLVLHFNNQTALSLSQIRSMVIAYSLAIMLRLCHRRDFVCHWGMS